jgi:hypothetical protein
MLIIVAAVIVLLAAVFISRIRAAGVANVVELGRMSERWLAEHRASHPA